MDARNPLPGDVAPRSFSLSLGHAKLSGGVAGKKAPLDPVIEYTRTIRQGLEAS